MFSPKCKLIQIHVAEKQTMISKAIWIPYQKQLWPRYHEPFKERFNLNRILWKKRYKSTFMYFGEAILPQEMVAFH